MEEGEELFISYDNTLSREPIHIRQATLFRGWVFHFACVACRNGVQYDKNAEWFVNSEEFRRELRVVVNRSRRKGDIPEKRQPRKTDIWAEHTWNDYNDHEVGFLSLVKSKVSGGGTKADYREYLHIELERVINEHLKFVEDNNVFKLSEEALKKYRASLKKELIKKAENE
ncbi:hypothetical protein B0J14DRAFT_649776 [Halenospora varia]|nr:hypothetical protein B0J14DRAFT_649776 [Halenospora varia]